MKSGRITYPISTTLFDITLLDVYKAVKCCTGKRAIWHTRKINLASPVGRNIQEAIEPLFSVAQLALEKALGNVTIEDVVADILEKESLNNNKD